LSSTWTSLARKPVRKRRCPGVLLTFVPSLSAQIDRLSYGTSQTEDFSAGVNANIYSISPASFAGSSFNKSAGDYCDGGGAEQTHQLLRHFILTMIILPRQARDKHRESTQKREASFAGKEYGPGYCLEVDWVESNGHCGGAGNASFAPFIYIYDHFTKTGSGQTQGKLKTKTRFP